MLGKVYLSYWANLKNTPINSERIRISRACPVDRCYYDKNLPSLYPSDKLLKDFKSGECNWIDYIKRYITSDKAEGIREIEELLKDGKDVTLFCYCSKMPCHKFILGEIFMRYGYEVLVLEKDKIRPYIKNEYLG